MTSLAMILGSLPLIISSGAGTEARKAIGYVLVGGLFFGTLLTLMMIPCFYIMIKRFASIRN
jgi:multidrug efflux pump subunit AcrB